MNLKSGHFYIVQRGHYHIVATNSIRDLDVVVVVVVVQSHLMTFCPHCSDNHISLSKKKGVKYFRCQKCGHQWVEKVTNKKRK